MGLAVGSMGMSLTDFCNCTPHEFFCISRHWEQTQMRDPWERARFLACCVLQPYSKKALKVTDVCRFSWDMQEKLSLAVESTRNRFEELKKNGWKDKD